MDQRGESYQKDKGARSFCILLDMYSQARTVIAIMVSVGFWQPLDTQQAPSVTNIFFDVVRLAVRIDYAGLRIGAHAGGPDLMDAEAGHGSRR